MSYSTTINEPVVYVDLLTKLREWERDIRAYRPDLYPLVANAIIELSGRSYPPLEPLHDGFDDDWLDHLISKGKSILDEAYIIAPEAIWTHTFIINTITHLMVLRTLPQDDI